MLTSLAIRDVVLIEALDLDFTAGLVVVTGETGAGKSILLDALGLALGDRASAALVRQGADAASVTASFLLATNAWLVTWLADNGIEHDAGEPLLIRRTVKRDGGSRAFVNGQPVSGTQLRSLGAALVEVHGQHDERGLLAPAGHRALLDAFGRIDTAATRAAHAAWRDAEAALTTAQTRHAEAARDRDWLSHAVAELDAFAPQDGEEEALATRRADLQRGEKLASEIETLQTLIEGSDGALPRLRQAARVLDRLAGDNALLAEALAAIDRALIEGTVADETLRRAADAYPYDPGRLEEDETRLFELRALARKHRVAPDALAGLRRDLAERLAAIEGGEAAIAAAQAAVARAHATFAAAAAALTSARTAAAIRLDTAVASELAPLKLDAARFRTVVAPGGDSEAGSDRVEFEVSTNPGMPFAPLLRIASGGELSRFILAFKVALAQEGGAATLVFDEIDRGVGGAVASAIGERLARLARDRQVMVVTHSPQVAARGTEHFLIAKNSEGTVTRTSLRVLNDRDRREEIARMLSGAHVTDEARAQAARLVDAA